MKDIKPYLTIKSEVNGFRFYHYLHIRGGSGDNRVLKRGHRNGGEFNFILFYASPDEMEGCDKCERIWCEEKGITYGEGDTIELAHASYLKKSARQAAKNGQK